MKFASLQTTLHSKFKILAISLQTSESWEFERKPGQILNYYIATRYFYDAINN